MRKRKKPAKIEIPDVILFKPTCLFNEESYQEQIAFTEGMTWYILDTSCVTISSYSKGIPKQMSETSEKWNGPGRPLIPSNSGFR